MKKIGHKIIVLLSLLSLSSLSFARNKMNLSDLALPSEVKSLRKQPGSVYYSPTSKGKPLIPVHFWGEIKKSGLHYVPVSTNLIKGISLAGGLTSTAELEEVKLTRVEKKGPEHKVFDLSAGGDANAYSQTLKAGDTVFVQKSRFYENRSYYTSLIGVLATIVSSYAIMREVKK